MDLGTASKSPFLRFAALLVAWVSLWPIGALCAVPAAATSPSTSTGTISGLITQPSGPHTPVSLMLENLQSSVVTVVPLADGQDSYSASVAAGTYQAFAWLDDFSLMGGYTACGQDETCTDHSLLLIEVGDGQTVTDAHIGDWHLPDSPLITLSGRLIDGSGADPIVDGVLVIWRRHIMAVGPGSQLQVPARALHYPLPGTTILPGFINTHVHNAYQPFNLASWATAGVTTVRDLGTPVASAWDTLQAFYEDVPSYARIIAAGPLVTCPDGYPIVPNGFPSLTVDSEDEARDETNSLIDRGAEVIKIVIESGVQEVLSLELARAIVDTAHARDIPVTVHLNLRRDLRTALDAGVDDVAHIVLDYVPDDLIQAMIDADVAWVPTLALLDGYGTQIYDNLNRFVAAGGRVALGNDAGYLAGAVIGMPLPEIEWMHHAGMTPMQIIVSATSDAATVCRRRDLIGTLEAGKIADVLVVQGDPLTDLRTLDHPRMVIHDGVIIRHEHPGPRHWSDRLGR